MQIDSTQRRLRKFFRINWLCLFPGFGILIGMVLIFYAIFKFKSKALFFRVLATMAGGVLLMVLDKAYLEHDFKYSKETESNFSVFNASNLDRVAQKLESYKSKYGIYPDSLAKITLFFLQE